MSVINANRAQRRQLARENLQWPEALREIPRETWPRDGGQRRVLRSRGFLVQEFAEADGVIRLSINRTELRGDGRWTDGITWDELQRLKREAGHGDRVAVEVFPPDSDVVNVANVRHLWLLRGAPAFMWKRGAE